MARRKPSQISTGRLKPLRLFSTLLLWTLVEGQQGLVFTCGGTSHRSSVSIRSTVSGLLDQLDTTSTAQLPRRGLRALNSRIDRYPLSMSNVIATAEHVGPRHALLCSNELDASARI